MNQWTKSAMFCLPFQYHFRPVPWRGIRIRWAGNSRAFRLSGRWNRRGHTGSIQQGFPVECRNRRRWVPSGSDHPVHFDLSLLKMIIICLSIELMFYDGRNQSHRPSVGFHPNQGRATAFRPSSARRVSTWYFAALPPSGRWLWAPLPLAETPLWCSDTKKNHSSFMRHSYSWADW